jgi:hypothetical protein
MSQQYLSSPQAAGKRGLFKLQHAGQHAQWKSNLQDYMFDKFHNTNMDKITSVSTLDADFFAKEFKEEHKAHSKDGDGGKVDPFTHAPAYGVMCFDHAIDTGDGFKIWLYSTFSYVRAALSDKIQKQTGQVRRGDLKALLATIQLAVHMDEQHNPDDLAIAYLKCTMEGEGDNDIMTFIAALSSYILRLDAVDMAPTEKRKIRVLLTGLDQDIYDNSSLPLSARLTPATPRFSTPSKGTQPSLVCLLRSERSSLATQSRFTPLCQESNLPTRSASTAWSTCWLLRWLHTKDPTGGLLAGTRTGPSSPAST